MKPTINGVRILARTAGARIRQADAYRILTPFRDSATTREQTRNNPGTEIPSSGNNPGTSPVVPRARAVKVFGSKSTSSLRSEAGTNGTTKKADDPPTWVASVRVSVAAINDVLLIDLSPDDRYQLARFHALEFAGCTKSEATNRSRAQSIATGIFNLADRLSRRPVTADVTVHEYIAYARQIVARSQRLWYHPLDVIAEIEIEEPHAIRPG